MNRQLHLLTSPRTSGHRLSEETKAVGRRGLAQARAALQAARTGRDGPPPADAVLTAHSHSHIRAQQRRTAA
jgi:hypothetical protein